MKNKIRLCTLLLVAQLPFTFIWATSQSFELRYITDDPAANGETDFKGPTEYMDTEQRVEFLDHYAQASKAFFDDAELAHEVISDEESAEIAKNIKPQPLPTVRQQIPLNEWQWLGYRKGKDKQASKRLNYWKKTEGVTVEQGSLLFTEHTDISWKFHSQSWRSSITWQAKTPSTDQKVAFEFSDKEILYAARLGFGEDAHFYYTTANAEVVKAAPYEADTLYTFKIEFDFAAFKRKEDLVRYNLYINGELIADYVPMERVNTRYNIGYAGNFTSIPFYNTFTVKGIKGLVIDNVWGLGHHLTGRESYPYTTETFIDDSFEGHPGIQGWETLGYDDIGWQTDTLPIAHGGERFTGEDLYLRKVLNIDSNYEKAYLNIETLDPGGAVWVNGSLVDAINVREHQRIEITRYLKPGEENIIAVKVNSFYLNEHDGEMMPHSSLDFNIGWFAGRMSLDLVGQTFVEDVFAYTETLGDDEATLNLELAFNNQYYLSFRGEAFAELTPWFPSESETPVATASYPVTLGKGIQSQQEKLIVENPMLWTPETPTLYKLRVGLKDANGNIVDDYVETIGIRTVDQIGGSFRLNGKISMLNGAQIFGYRAPLETMLKDSRAAPDHWVAKEIMQIKRMNGNLLRIHVHGWEFPARGINDPRYAECADQLGIMLLWCPTAWIRTGRGWGDVDFDALPENLKQVRNHPSIVMWEAANHTQSFKKIDVKESNLYMEQVYNTIYPVDPSRIISYNSFIWHFQFANDEGTIDHQGNPIKASWAWTAPRVTRGNQDSNTGYGKHWGQLRDFPNRYRQSMLDSQERAYFNFEHQESIGQPNWNLVRGKPWYRMQSYEWRYDDGSIGRKLTADEWEASQAWQGFSAWEAMKKMRFLDYDGFSWCCLHGGANSVTYKKPLIDFLGYAKIAWHTNKMVFQNTVAGSADVDTVYGPEDQIAPIIMHLGDESRKNLIVLVKNLEGDVIHTEEYSNIELEGGRSATPLKPFKPNYPEKGYYLIEYHLEK